MPVVAVTRETDRLPERLEREVVPLAGPVAGRRA